MNIVLLAGGTGGARLARGMAASLDPRLLTVVTNTADDDTFFGLRVSPDTDSVLYHLAGCFNESRGFGVAGDTFHALGMLQRLGETAWFQLGDRDIALQLQREQLRRNGMSLSQAVGELAQRLGIRCLVAPMSDDTVSTRIATHSAELRFQEWFVRERTLPEVRGIRFEGIETARPSPAAMRAVAEADLVVVAPSNPLISIDPILAVLGPLPTAIPVVAVSPIVAGRALKGPLVRMLQQLGRDPSAAGIARHYSGVATDFVLHTTDAGDAETVASHGLRPHILDTVMGGPAAEARLATALLGLFSPATA
ncbi:MAG: 2-phospho-L-lactate transferase [Candidatus Dormibacteraeota bacterium]|nr:2-phospho-L-lactate transferase [Candidatus Dormibacteraeota bacterium]